MKFPRSVCPSCVCSKLRSRMLEGDFSGLYNSSLTIVGEVLVFIARNTIANDVSEEIGSQSPGGSMGECSPRSQSLSLEISPAKRQPPVRKISENFSSAWLPRSTTHPAFVITVCRRTVIESLAQRLSRPVRFRVNRRGIFLWYEVVVLLRPDLGPRQFFEW